MSLGIGDGSAAASAAPWLVIFNPASAGGRGASASAVAHELRRAGVPHELVSTEGAGHATQLASQARVQGWRRVVAAGGDGTAHEVVNGLLGAAGGSASTVTIGILPLGSGNDWARTLGVPRRLERACRLLAAGRAIPSDVGSVTLDAGERRATTYFVGIAGVGIDGRVVRDLECRPRGPWRYYAGLVRALRRFHAPRLEITAGQASFAGAFLAAFVCNGRYLGGGMRIAAGARFDDGLLDLVLVEDMPAMRVLAQVPRLVAGDLGRSPRARVLRCGTVRIDGVGELQADGQSLGRSPASFAVVPGAVQVMAGVAH